MVMSMTGYGSETLHLDEMTIEIEIRCVNSRYLDFAPKIPRLLHELEAEIKQIIQSYFRRGRVELYVSVDGGIIDDKALHINWELLDQYVEHLRSARERYQLAEDFSLATITTIDDIFAVKSKEQLSPDVKGSILTHLHKVAQDVVDSRYREGTFLREDVEKRIAIIEGLLTSIEKDRKKVYNHYYNRIKERMEQVIGEHIEVAETQLLQEIALLAEKGDITEELTRLVSHIEHFRRLLGENEAIGRKLDFVIQEMNREINTIGAKSIDATISESVVIIKSELEKIREQVQNIE